MTATKRMTKQALLKAAVAKWGRSAYIDEDSRCPSPEKKKLISQEVAKARTRKEELNELMTSLGKEPQLIRDLITAAEFVVDVNGDAPSIQQLEAPLEKLKLFRSYRDEWSELGSFIYKNNGVDYWHRFSAGTISKGPIPFCHCLCNADTMEDLYTLIQQHGKTGRPTTLYPRDLKK